MSAGSAQGGQGGRVALTGGSSVHSDGGEIKVTSGASENANGGDLVLDAGPSTSGVEGYVRIASNSASYVRIGRSSVKQVPVDIFGDVTIHGNIMATNNLAFQDTYSQRIHLTTTQNMMAQGELRVPTITGLDTEDHATLTPTSAHCLPLDSAFCAIAAPPCSHTPGSAPA